MHRLYRRTLAVFFCHWIATLGVILTSASAIVFITFQFLSFNNVYYAIVVYLIVPAFFVAGLLLIPIGVYLGSRAAGGFRAVLEDTRADDQRLLRLAVVVLAATLANVVLMAGASYKGVEYMDSDEFCGVVCHSPMAPQYEAHMSSPHAEVACVGCHVGPGPESFLRAKVAGLGRVMGMMTGGYDRPLRISEVNRQPLVGACENCHWRGQRQGEPLRLIRHYGDDQESTPMTTVLLMRVDTAIHAAHLGRDIYYRSEDPERQVIPWVSADGVEYVSSGVPNSGPQRMHCLDCHNRVAHSFGPAERVLDQAFADQRIDRSAPFAKRDALEALDRAAQGDPSAVAGSVELSEILRRNVFPSMAVTWNTYPDNIGHQAYPGCFRCHDGQHSSASGQTISQDCFGCHNLLAVEDRQPAILDQLGISP